MTTLARPVADACTAYRVGENTIMVCGVHVWVARLPRAELERMAFPDGVCFACAH